MTMLHNHEVNAAASEIITILVRHETNIRALECRTRDSIMSDVFGQLLQRVADHDRALARAAEVREQRDTARAQLAVAAALRDREAARASGAANHSASAGRAAVPDALLDLWTPHRVTELAGEPGVGKTHVLLSTVLDTAERLVQDADEQTPRPAGATAVKRAGGEGDGEGEGDDGPPAGVKQELDEEQRQVEAGPDDQPPFVLVLATSRGWVQRLQKMAVARVRSQRPSSTARHTSEGEGSTTTQSDTGHNDGDTLGWRLTRLERVLARIHVHQVENIADVHDVLSVLHGSVYGSSPSCEGGGSSASSSTAASAPTLSGSLFGGGAFSVQQVLPAAGGPFANAVLWHPTLAPAQYPAQVKQEPSGAAAAESSVSMQLEVPVAKPQCAPKQPTFDVFTLLDKQRACFDLDDEVQSVSEADQDTGAGDSALVQLPPAKRIRRAPLPQAHATFARAGTERVSATRKQGARTKKRLGLRRGDIPITLGAALPVPAVSCGAPEAARDEPLPVGGAAAGGTDPDLDDVDSGLEHKVDVEMKRELHSETGTEASKPKESDADEANKSMLTPERPETTPPTTAGVNAKKQACDGHDLDLDDIEDSESGGSSPAPGPGFVGFPTPRVVLGDASSAQAAGSEQEVKHDQIHTDDSDPIDDVFDSDSEDRLHSENPGSGPPQQQQDSQTNLLPEEERAENRRPEQASEDVFGRKTVQLFGTRTSGNANTSNNSSFPCRLLVVDCLTLLLTKRLEEFSSNFASELNCSADGLRFSDMPEQVRKTIAKKRREYITRAVAGLRALPLPSLVTSHLVSDGGGFFDGAAQGDDQQLAHHPGCAEHHAGAGLCWNCCGAAPPGHKVALGRAWASAPDRRIFVHARRAAEAESARPHYLFGANGLDEDIARYALHPQLVVKGGSDGTGAVIHLAVGDNTVQRWYDPSESAERFCTKCDHRCCVCATPVRAGLTISGVVAIAPQIQTS